MIAPMVLDGPINQETFVAYVEQFLAPALSALSDQAESPDR